MSAAETWHKAVHYLALAAEHSLKLFAIRESLQWFDRALALVQAHRGAATPAQQMALHERRGAARAQADQTDGAVADFGAIELARALGEDAHTRDVLTSLGMAYRRADHYEQAIACLDEALASARAGGDERHVADSLYHLGTVAWSNGRNDLAIAYHQEAVDLCERLQLRDLVAVQAWHGQGEACFADGQPADAMDCFSRSLELARAIGDRSYEAENLLMLGWASGSPMGLGDPLRALSFLDPALEIARAADLQWHLGPALIGRAFACVAAGPPCTGRRGPAGGAAATGSPRPGALPDHGARRPGQPAARARGGRPRPSAASNAPWCSPAAPASATGRRGCKQGWRWRSCAAGAAWTGMRCARRCRPHAEARSLAVPLPLEALAEAALAGATGRRAGPRGRAARPRRTRADGGGRRNGAPAAAAGRPGALGQ